MLSAQALSFEVTRRCVPVLAQIPRTRTLRREEAPPRWSAGKSLYPCRCTPRARSLVRCGGKRESLGRPVEREGRHPKKECANRRPFFRLHRFGAFSLK